MGIKFFGFVIFIDDFIILNIDYSYNNNNVISYMTTTNNVDFVVWHTSLGHIGQDRMNWLDKHDLLGQMAKITLSTREYCLAEKSPRKSFGKAIKASIPLQLIYSNICGPMNMKASHCTTYFITIIDYFTYYNHVYLIFYKLEALECFRWFMRLVEIKLKEILRFL